MAGAAHVPQASHDIHGSGAGIEDKRCSFILKTNKQKKKEDSNPSQEVIVKLYVEVTGWRVLYKMLCDSNTVVKALNDLIAVAESKSSLSVILLYLSVSAKKASLYIRKEILKYLKKLVLSNSTPIEVKELVATAWGKLGRRGIICCTLLVADNYRR